jgi:hypothetical protein
MKDSVGVAMRIVPAAHQSRPREGKQGESRSPAPIFTRDKLYTNELAVLEESAGNRGVSKAGASLNCYPVPSADILEKLMDHFGIWETDVAEFARIPTISLRLRILRTAESVRDVPQKPSLNNISLDFSRSGHRSFGMN